MLLSFLPGRARGGARGQIGGLAARGVSRAKVGARGRRAPEPQRRSVGTPECVCAQLFGGLLSQLQSQFRSPPGHFVHDRCRKSAPTSAGSVSRVLIDVVEAAASCGDVPPTYIRGC